MVSGSKGESVHPATSMIDGRYDSSAVLDDCGVNGETGDLKLQQRMWLLGEIRTVRRDVSGRKS